MKFIYLIGVRLYELAVRIAALWNPKARKWVAGRKAIWSKLDNWKREEKTLYWFHCASLGEFEQGRPIIEGLKSKEDCQVVLTFFSPSGYEIRSNYDLADLVIYLPLERKSHVTRFLDAIAPDAVFFVKYEFWAQFIFEAKKRGAKLYSVAAVFREKQIFFKRYGGFMRSVLQCFDKIFTQDEKSHRLLNGIGVHSIVAGDTRYDRVLANAEKVEGIPLIENFVGDSSVLVVGSSWKADDEVVLPFINHPDLDWKIIIAPHEIHENRIVELQKQITKSVVRYSQMNTSGGTATVLIIDNIGMLMNVYQYATIAYVGGGFGTGLHNILEPASFNVPVVFGNQHEKFFEAKLFMDAGIGFEVTNAADFEQCMKELMDKFEAKKVAEYMQKHQGATQRILEHV